MSDEANADPNAPIVDPNAGFDAAPILASLTDMVTTLETEVAGLKKFVVALIAEKSVLVQQFQVVASHLAPKVQAAIDLVRSHIPQS